MPDGARLAAAWQELHQAGGAAMAFAGGLTEAGADAADAANVADVADGAAGAAGATAAGAGVADG